MADAISVPAPALDVKTLLARVDHRLALLRAWLSHHHGDEPFWWARQTTARESQRERHVLRGVANLLHVERATSRGRIHGTQFATLDDQRAWLERESNRWGALAPSWTSLPANATLAQIRAGELPI